MQSTTPFAPAHLLNMVAINRLVQKTSASLFPQIVRIFTTETNKHKRHIQHALLTKDSFSLAQEAHSLRSSAQWIGAEQLYQTALQIEHDCKHGDIDTAFSLSAQIPQLIEHSLAALAKTKLQ
jgi:HPt (histidine-containing phosphotransfer) domain-containing protein